MFLRVVALITVALAVLAGCASSGAPESFADQPGPVPPEWSVALDSSQNINAIPLTQRNFLEGCITSDPEVRYTDLNLTEDELIRACGCGYTGLVEDLRLVADDGARTEEQIEAEAFNLYKEIDSSAEETVNQRVQVIFERCLTSNP